MTVFSSDLQKKIDLLAARRTPVQLGSVSFDSPLLLAPMSSICTAPFRLLMEELGCGGTVSELISCHGINYKNQKTVNMLKIDPREKNIGIQLFGEDPEAMAIASKVAQESGPKFIDINMGCPVRKVVTKGGGSALLQDPSKLGHFFGTMKKALEVPLTIKIRTGWDEGSINAAEVIRIAREEGVEFVAIHGRTRTQQYKGSANWNILEEMATDNVLPIIGNGDLHTTHLVKERMSKTNCPALMLGRGPLRNPFIFLEPYLKDTDDIQFSAADCLEVVERYLELLTEHTPPERTRAILLNMRKQIVWFASGYPGVTKFRGEIFKAKDLDETMKLTRDYFNSLTGVRRAVDETQAFLTGGHG